MAQPRNEGRQQRPENKSGATGSMRRDDDDKRADRQDRKGEDDADMNDENRGQRPNDNTNRRPQ